ncbi:MAG: histidine kinase dimerization/phosphoacceptor domain -containing protein [bacterium]
MMNFFSIISAILFLLYLELGLYVVLKNKRSNTSIYFFLLSLCFSIYSFAYIFVYSANTPEAASRWDSFASVGYCLFPAFMALFHKQINDPNSFKKWHIPVFVILFSTGFFLSAAALLDFWKAEKIIMGKHSWHFVHNPKDIFYYVFYLYLFLSTILTFYFLAQWRKKIEDKYELVQYRLTFYPLISFLILGIFFDIIGPHINLTEIPNIGHITSLPWIIGISIGILKFRFISNLEYIVANKVINEINQIVIFINNRKNIIKTNPYTQILLGEDQKSILKKNILRFFRDQKQFDEHLRKTMNKEDNHHGPIETDIIDKTNNPVQCKLYFLAIKDQFKDTQGFIIYGHDNRESVNLKNEIKVRQEAEKNLRAISDVLETRVKERTRELANSYKELQIKMTERMRVEEQIKSDIAEKEILINEILNRVKSNMNIIISLIKAQDRQNKGETISKKFKELAQRVKSLLLVHNNLYLSINYSDVDFTNFIKDLTSEISAFYNHEKEVEIRLHLSEVFLDVDYAIPMATVVNELISNAYQHAFPAKSGNAKSRKKNIIDVTYTLENDYYEIVIADNGIGLPDNFVIEDLDTNGLPLADILISDQVNGKFETFSSKDGSMFKITFHSD